MKGSHRELLEHLGLIIQMGLTIVVAILLGFFGGQWLDGRLETGMVFTFVGLALGVASGFRSAYELVRRALSSSRGERQG